MLEHPSPFITFPSSQTSVPSLILFPHVCQTLGWPFQAHPDSIAQELLHPSPLVVFPSSHTSVDIMYPSPHNESSTVNVYGDEPAKVKTNTGLKMEWEYLRHFHKPSLLEMLLDQNLGPIQFEMDSNTQQLNL